jgi:ubiquitin C-terminal hydrolase
MVDVLRCKSCGFERQRVDPFLDLDLNVAGTPTLEESLRRFTAVETLSGDNQWFCETCSKKVDAEKGLRLQSLPHVLTLHLKR